jgi:hypothetical protein
MKRPGFSVSTILLVLILLGAVAWVGSLVNPIKHGPGDGHDHGNEQQDVEKVTDKKANDAASNSSETRAKIEKNEADQRRRMMQDMAKRYSSEPKKKGVAVPMKDPEAIDPTPTHFFEADMGAAGIEKQREQIAIQKKAYDAQVAKQRQSPFGKTMAIDADAPVPPKGGQAGDKKSSEEHGHEGHDH